MKSLSQLFAKDDSDVGKGDVTTFYSKKIRSPGGKEHFVPGHVSDFIEPADLTGERFNHDLLTQSNWNLNRWQTRVKKKFDTTFDAVPIESDREKTVKDMT